MWPFLQHAPPPRFHLFHLPPLLSSFPPPFFQYYRAVKPCPTIASGGLFLVHGFAIGIRRRTPLAIWQYQFCSLWQGPVTLRQRLPGMPPPLASVRGDQWGFNVSVLLTLGLFPSSSLFSFPLPLFFLTTIILVANIEGFRRDCESSVKTLGCLLKASAPSPLTAALL